MLYKVDDSLFYAKRRRMKYKYMRSELILYIFKVGPYSTKIITNVQFSDLQLCLCCITYL